MIWVKDTYRSLFLVIIIISIIIAADIAFDQHPYKPYKDRDKISIEDVGEEEGVGKEIYNAMIRQNHLVETTIKYETTNWIDFGVIDVYLMSLDEDKTIRYGISVAALGSGEKNIKANLLVPTGRYIAKVDTKILDLEALFGPHTLRGLSEEIIVAGKNNIKIEAAAATAD